MKPSDFIHHDTPTPGTHYACKDGFDFARRFETMAQVWESCERPDWLLWILDKLELPYPRERRLFACWCAERALARVKDPDPRSVDALRVARLFADGLATGAELAAARAAAWDARDAAWAAWAAADAAAWDARDAAWAADAAAWAAARAAAGRDSECKAQADHLRTLIPNPFLKANP